MRLIVLGLILLLASPVVSQERVLEVGDRVRVKMENLDETLFGEYEGVEDRYLLVRQDGEPTATRLPSWAVEDVKVQTGTKSNTVRGAVIGGVALGLGMGIYGALLGRGVSSFSAEVSEDEGTVVGTAMGALVGGLAGAGVGALIGSAIRSDVWEPVELPAKPLVAVLHTGRFSFGVSIPVER
jgi:hypothetical protein